MVREEEAEWGWPTETAIATVLVVEWDEEVIVSEEGEVAAEEVTIWTVAVDAEEGEVA